MHDVIIIGAGPIGSYVGQKLAKNGHDVVLIEKRESFIKDPVCTGVIGVEAFERFNLPQDAILSEIKNLLFYAPSGLTLPFYPNSPLAYVVDRNKLDQWLRDLALKNGASIRVGTAINQICLRDTHVEVGVNGGKKFVKAKTVVIATGYNQKLVESLGLGETPDWTTGVQTEATMRDVKETEILVGNKIAPGSFAWVVGLGNGKARIGLATKRKPTFYLQNLLDCQYLRDRVCDKGVISKKFIPIGHLKRTFHHRLLVVGEAAGQVKTTTHGGIYYGLIGAEFVVETLKKAFAKGSFGQQIMGTYEKQWKHALNREIKAGCIFRKIFSYLQDDQINQIFKYARNNGIMDIVNESARFDWHGPLIFELLKYFSLNLFNQASPKVAWLDGFFSSRDYQ